MWRSVRDYFSFTRKDLRGIYVLLAILALLLSVRISLPYVFSDPEPDFSEFDKMVLALEKAQRQARETAKLTESTLDIPFIRPDREIAENKLNPFYFDPNLMSEQDWVRLGLSTRQIRNIHNFVASGGRFRKADDLKRIYTISQAEYEILRPFIRIESVQGTVTSEHTRTEQTLLSDAPAKQRMKLLIDINQADSVELLKVRGIGPVFAQRIIRYRDQLGGFHSREQLLEVYGIDSNRYNQIAGQFSFDNTALRLININTAEVRDLTSHPYIDFYLAKSIVDQRIKRGGKISDTDIYGIPMMHDALYRKLMPYFNFNE